MRDEFLRPVQQLLAKRVGYRCSLCGAPTAGPAAEVGRSTNVGEAAHITAASPGGPRFDPSLSAEERRSPENGIWLCCTCGRKIDVDTRLYTVDVLRNRKTQAEEEAQSTLGVASPFLRIRAPLKLQGTHEPRFTEVESYYHSRGYATYLIPVEFMGAKLCEGYELGLDPVSGGEVRVVVQGPPWEEHVLIVLLAPGKDKTNVPN